MLAPFLIGIAAGLRAGAPLAVLAVHDRHRHPRRALLAGAMATGELVADKLPSTPARTDAGPMVARLVSGGLAGSVVVSNRVLGAALGAVGAVVGTYIGYCLRAAAAARAGHDWPVAAIEDGLAVAIARFAARAR